MTDDADAMVCVPHAERTPISRERGIYKVGKATDAGTRIRHLHELSESLQSAGYIAQVIEKDRVPFVEVTNPDASQFSEVIRCDAALSGDGAFAFYWSWGEPICLASQVEEATRRIRNVICDLSTPCF